MNERSSVENQKRSMAETAVATPPPAAERPVVLFPDEEGKGFRTRWDAIQTGFVDKPREAVEQADALVAEVMRRLTDVFADERKNLEHQWGQGGEATAEDLRLALKRYRSFFERLLHV